MEDFSQIYEAESKAIISELKKRFNPGACLCILDGAKAIIKDDISLPLMRSLQNSGVPLGVVPELLADMHRQAVNAQRQVEQEMALQEMHVMQQQAKRPQLYVADYPKK